MRESARQPWENPGRCGINLLRSPPQSGYKVEAFANQETRMGESLKLFLREIRRQLKSAAIPTFLLALTAIFAWQATQGAHGLIMRERRKTELAQAEANLV